MTARASGVLGDETRDPGATRLKAVVAQSPRRTRRSRRNLDHKTLGNREYLFGLGPALMSIYEGAKR